jgi:hypothetical protein
LVFFSSALLACESVIFDKSEFSNSSIHLDDTELCYSLGEDKERNGITLTVISFENAEFELSINSDFYNQSIPTDKKVASYELGNHDGNIKFKLKARKSGNLTVRAKFVKLKDIIYVNFEIIDNLTSETPTQKGEFSLKIPNENYYQVSSEQAENCNSSNTAPKNPNNNHINLHANIKQAKTMAEASVNPIPKLIWFKGQVNTGQRWDFKSYYRGVNASQRDREIAARYGNFHYGATGAALGVPDDILYRAAGWHQLTTPNTDENWGHWLGSAPYGDDPNDQEWILKGINYYKSVYLSKARAEQDSARDFCNLENEVGERYVGPDNRDGGSNGGSGPGPGPGNGAGSPGSNMCIDSGSVCTGGGCNYWREITICPH